jgi:hypothetical protein
MKAPRPRRPRAPRPSARAVVLLATVASALPFAPLGCGDDRDADPGPPVTSGSAGGTTNEGQAGAADAGASGQAGATASAGAAGGGTTAALACFFEREATCIAPWAGPCASGPTAECPADKRVGGCQRTSEGQPPQTTWFYEPRTTEGVRQSCADVFQGTFLPP